MTRNKQNGRLRPAWLILACVFFVSPVFSATEKLRIGFLCPKPPLGFWGQVVDVMQAAADDLDIELIIKCDASNSTIGAKRVGVELLNHEPKLHYFVSGYWASVTKFHLEQANARGINMIIFNADIRDDEKPEFGQPRGKFENWIGHMVPDDRGAAMELMRILVTEARRVKGKAADEPVYVQVFRGEGGSPVSRSRIEGLHAQAEAMPGTVLREVALEFWKMEWARDEAIKALEIHPAPDVIWAGGHASAWGAVQGAELAGKKPGQDILVGGFDWNAESLKALADGRMSASMFGHFIEGAWALVLAYDHYHGIDFANDVGLRIATPMKAMTPAAMAGYSKLVSPGFWSGVDFREYSKKYNPELKLYNFDIDQFVD